MKISIERVQKDRGSFYRSSDPTNNVRALKEEGINWGLSMQIRE